MIALRPLQFCDLAVKTEKDPGVKMKPDGTVLADWFVIATGAKINTFLYVLDIFRAQLSFPEQVKAIKREHLHWKSIFVGIEDYAYQWSLGQQAWTEGVPCLPCSYPGDKVYKAQVITNHIETGRVRFRGIKEGNTLVIHPSLRRWMTESRDFPFGDNDDVVDAIVGLIHMAMDEEVVAKQFAGTVTSGYAMAIVGGVRRGDPFDVIRSNY